MKREEQIRHGSMKSCGIRNALRIFIAGLHHKHIVCMGKILGMLLYSLDVRHRRIVRRNLHFTYPEWPWKRIIKLSKKIFKNMGVTVLEILQMVYFSEEDILKKVKIIGEEHLLNVAKNNRGAIIISAHLGNWEMGQLLLSCYFKKPIVGVAREIKFKPLNRWVYKFRTRFGNKIIKKKAALPEMKKTLRQRKILGLLVDQGTTRGEGVDATFFGRTVKATPSVALLAIRYNCPVIPIFCIRMGNGFTIIVYPPLSLQRTDNLRSDIQANTQVMMDVIEKAVRCYPEQWFWVHKRWKRFYPDLYKEDLVRRRRYRDRKNRKMNSGKNV